MLLKGRMLPDSGERKSEGESAAAEEHSVSGGKEPVGGSCTYADEVSQQRRYHLCHWPTLTQERLYAGAVTAGSSGTPHLPKATLGLQRARRMFDDLKKYEYDRTGFLDRLPYVLDLLWGVTRTINKESKGKRTIAFSTWWTTLSVQLQAEIERLRHAELKALESQTGRLIDVVIYDASGVSDSVGRYEGRPVNPDDTAVTITWVFSGGPLDQQPLLPVLEQYLNNLGSILADAESRLAQAP